MLLVTVVICLLCLNGVLVENIGDNYCKDQKIQEHIDMKQLTGMWFAVEVISHLKNSTSMSQFYAEPTTIETEICAVVTISDRPNVPLSPMYKNIKKYNQSYSPEYTVYEAEEAFTDHPSSQYYGTNHNRYKELQKYRQKLFKHFQDRKDLSVTWDEFHTTKVYAAYYTFPEGLWYIYEPTAERLDKALPNSHLVGNIQVLKAVGNHIVLTFCIRWPEEQLFTVLLSRAPRMSQYDVSGVHNLLRRLELEFVKIKRMCLLNGATRFSANYVFLVVLSMLSVMFL